MVLRAFWSSLGISLGATWGLLGLLFDFHIDQKGLPIIELATSWALVGLFFSLLAAEDGLENILGPTWAASGCSWKPLGTCFGALRRDLELPKLALRQPHIRWAMLGPM